MPKLDRANSNRARGDRSLGIIPPRDHGESSENRRSVHRRGRDDRFAASGWSVSLAGKVQRVPIDIRIVLFVLHAARRIVPIGMHRPTRIRIAHNSARFYFIQTRADLARIIQGSFDVQRLIDSGKRCEFVTTFSALSRLENRIQFAAFGSRGTEKSRETIAHQRS